MGGKTTILRTVHTIPSLARLSELFGQDLVTFGSQRRVLFSSVRAEHVFCGKTLLARWDGVGRFDSSSGFFRIFQSTSFLVIKLCSWEPTAAYGFVQQSFCSSVQMLCKALRNVRFCHVAPCSFCLHT